ncbi:Crp/Fnr family transcriptional regulator [Dongia sp.]|uniref:Crp/Fnr family transcriptional regulator n=1 Tax=Dongia sp. TaxID=1977262 RepID=UPI0035B25335
MLTMQIPNTEAPRLAPQQTGKIRPGRPVLRRFAAGGTIYIEGDPAGTIYEVLSGTLLLYRTLDSSSRQIVEIAGPGSLVGLPWHGRQMSSAQAVSVVELKIVDERGQLECVANDPRYALKLVEQVGRLYQSNTIIGRGTALQKLAFFLIHATDYGNKIARKSSEQSTFALKVTRRQIGEFLGITLETVSRGFAQLQREGVLRMSAFRFFEILDHDRLFDLASGRADGAIS